MAGLDRVFAKLNWKVEWPGLTVEGPPLTSPVFFAEEYPDITFRVKADLHDEDDPNLIRLTLLDESEEPVKYQFYNEGGDEGLRVVATAEGWKSITVWNNTVWLQMVHEPDATAVTRHLPDIHFVASFKPFFPKPTAQYTSLLLADDTYADFRLICEKQELKIHRGIFAVASPFFETAFRQEEEKKQGWMIITDFPFQALVALKNYIYTGVAEEMWKDLHLYLRMADQYQIMKLKNSCEAAMVEGLNYANLCQFAIAADLHRCPKLFEKCQWLFKEPEKEISGKVSKEDLQRLTNVPGLTFRLLQGLVPMEHDQSDSEPSEPIE